jgi:hypothetical protein
MVGMTERNKQKVELASLGYSMDYVDGWQPKTRLYRHKPSYNVEGALTDEVGTYVENVPGSPDYVLRKSRIGLFTWPPSEECECQWCTERTTKTLSNNCDHCDFQPKGETPAAIASSLRMHIQHRHMPVESA